MNLRKKIGLLVIVIIIALTSVFGIVYYADIGEFLELSRANTDGGGGTRSMQVTASQFQINGCGAGTVLDTVTNICWQRNWSGYLAVDGDGVNWTQAVAYCDDLTLGESSNWSLPTIKQFRRLISEDNLSQFTYYGAIDNQYITDLGFQDTGSGGLYWSATERTPDSSAWYVILGNGGDGWGNQSNDNFRAVCSVWNN